MKNKLVLFLAVVLIIASAAGVYFLNPFANKIKSGLQVVTHGTSASLFLNDHYLDKTPFNNEQIMPGKYQLKIIPDDSNLATYELPITLNRGYLSVVIWKPGKTTETSGGIIYELESLSNKNETEVSIISNPDNAIVNFGNYEEKFTPLIFKNVEPGDYNIEINLISFDTQKHTVKVIQGHRLNIFTKLAKSKSAFQEDETAVDSEASSEEATDSADLEEQTEMDLMGSQILKIASTNFFQDEVEVLRVREKPSLNDDIIGFAAVDKTYEYFEEKEDWFKIEFIDPVDNMEKIGWVSGAYVQVLDTTNEEATDTE